MTQLAFGTVAPTSRRAVAYIIDAAIAAGIAIVLGILLAIFATIAGPDGMLSVISIGAPVVWLVMIGWFVFYTFMQSGNGSIGMRAQGLRLVQETDGAPLGFGRTLLRNVIFGLAASIVVGYFTPLFDGSGRFQGWHDKVARSLMIDARTGGSPVGGPPTTAMHVPPRPGMPNAGMPNAGMPNAGMPNAGMPNAGMPNAAMPSTGQPNAAPPVPGLATPPSQFAFPAPNPTEHGGHQIPGLTPVRPGSGYSSPESIAYAALVGPPSPSDEATPALDETIPAPPAPRAPELPVPAQPSIAQPPAPLAGDESLIAFVPGITQDGPPARSTPAPAEPAPPTAPTAPTAPPQDSPAAAPELSSAPVTPAQPPLFPAPTQAAAVAQAPSDDLGGDLGEVEDTRISIPGHRLVFTWDDGTKVTVSQRTLFGRNPAPEEGAVAVIVRDETLSLSKTHFEAAAEATGGWIKDRHSTNGTVIVRDGERIPCAPGEQVRIRLGDAIEIGDRIVTIGGYA